MRTLKLRTSFSLNDLFISLAMFCVVSFAVLEHSSVAIPLASMIKMPLMYAGGICILTQAKLLLSNLLKRKYFYTLLILLVFCLGLLLTMYVNRDTRIGEDPARQTVRFILYLVELFALVIILAERGESERILKFLFRYLVVTVLVTDFLLLSGAMRFYSGRHEYYLVGTKFSVSYLHMNLLVLWVMRRQGMNRDLRLPRWLIAVLAIFVLLVAVRVDCMTGVVGCVALVVLFALLESPRRAKMLRFTSPVILLLFFFGSALVSFITEEIMSIPFVSYIVEDVLGRDSTLTGRVNIYLQYADRISGHWMTGYGFGNGNAVSVALFGYENTQNAILQWIIQVGIPGTCILLFMMMYIFHRASLVQGRKLARIMPLVVLIYVYIILGTVETTFNMKYIMWFALIFMIINEKEDAPANAMQA